MKIKEPLFKYQYVMLIDDSELDNFINERILQSAHFARRIYVHTSGKSALEFLNNLKTMGKALAEVRPDVIFIDLNMPLMNGFHFLDQYLKIKEPGFSPRLAILTSSVNEDDKKKARSIKEDIIFLNKPLSSHLLESF
jgi:CheY-like chemotaxis protein